MADALVEYESHRNSNPNGDGSHKSGSGNERSVRAARECTYKEFLNCQPFNFKANDGVTVGHDAAYGMLWKTLMKMMTKKNPTAANNQRTLTCYDYRDQGHYMSDCPELKNQNHGNQPGNGEARGKVYALGRGETDQDPNNMEDDINA
nr:hypothetical protein [Tanacetum cinerariifolium]